jgi:uncharacterized protein YpmS
MRTKVPLIIAGLIVLQSICLCTAAERLQPSPTPPPSATAAPAATPTQNPATGSVVITVTEEQLTALIERSLAEQEEPLPVSEPEVQLQDGHIEIRADVTLAEGASTASTLTLKPSVVDGAVEITVEEATLGQLPAPPAAVDALADYIETTVNEQLLSQVPEGTLTAIQIADGTMTIYATSPSE